MMQLYLDLTEAEAAKLHALGGATWVRLQVQSAPEPTGIRGLYGLTADERRRLLEDLPRLGRAATAYKYRVKPTAVDILRRGACIDIDFRRHKVPGGLAA